MFLTLPYPTEYASVAAQTCRTREGYRRQRASIIRNNRHARFVIASPNAASWERSYWTAALVSNRRFAANARAVYAALGAGR